MGNNVIIMNPKRYYKNKCLDTARFLLCSILSFLLSLSIVGLTVLIIIQWGCFSKNAFYKNLLSSEYYTYLQSDIYKEVEAITLPTGLSFEVSRDTIHLYKVHQDVNGFIDASFRGEVYDVDTSQMENKLEQNVRDFLAAETISSNDEQEEGIQYYIQSIVEAYNHKIKSPFFQFYLAVKERFHNIYRIAITVTILLLIVILLLIIKMNHWLHRSLRYVTYSVTAAGLMTAIAPAYILYSGFYKRINLSTQYLYQFVTTYITDIFQMFLCIGFCLLAVAIILMIKIKSMKRSVIKQ